MIKSNYFFRLLIKFMTPIINRFCKPIKNILSPDMLKGMSMPVKKMASCYASETEGGVAFAGRAYPDEYISLVRRDIMPEVYENYQYFLGKWRYVPAKPARLYELFEFASCIHIGKLWSGGKGTGTKAVQDVVRQSLNNPRTCGRVILEACCIDGKTAPGGFYYKLGFRFADPNKNEECAKWLASGGKRENAPFSVGLMYLPRENIEHCLKYGLSSNEIMHIKQELDFYRAAGLIK